MKVTSAPKSASTIVMKTSDKQSMRMAQWWRASSDTNVAQELISTVAFLKETQQNRQRQTAIFAKLYGNQSLFSFIGQSPSKIDMSTNASIDRPTFNLIQSAVDTLVSRLSQSRPSPVFLTDNGDYKERNLAKKLNNFIMGEFYQTKTYEKVAIMLRDALVTGTGILKVYESNDNKVALDRVLLTELFVDPNESMYGDPRQLYQIKLVDRAVLMENNPKFKSTIKDAENAYPDNSADSSKTISDLVMVVEGWHLPSGKNAKDGRHTIACSSGIILDEDYTKDRFPFVFLHASPRLLGFWSQGIAEQLMGTQVEINSLLYTISKAIKLVGVPRVFIEKGSKVTKTSQNNDVGVIVEYSGIKPIYEVAPCVPQEMYAQLQRLIDFGYKQCGVSQLEATSQKPAGLNSGEAIRSYDDIATDRSAALARRHDDTFIDLTYLMVDLAKDIAERDGKYQALYPNKNGVKEIDLPKMSLLKNSFVVQVFNQSSLPRDPAGRMQKVTEMIQAGMITIKEGRRLLDFPDLDQIEKLANASEERIFQILDDIIEDGNYVGPDPFMDLDLATQLSVQYINLYGSAKLEEDKAQMLRDFFSQTQTLKQAAQSTMPAPEMVPQARPEQLPTSPLIPNAPQGISGAV